MMLRRLALAALLVLAPSLAFADSFAIIGPTPPATENSKRLATTEWVNSFFAGNLPLAQNKIFIGSAGSVATQQTISGDCTLVASGVITCTQSAGAFTINGIATITGGVLLTNISAPSTPAAGKTQVYVDSTQKVLTFKNDAGTVGNAVVPSTCGANLFGTSISAAGVFGCTQPAVSNISGFGTGAGAALGANVNASGGIVSPVPTRAGDIIYWNGSAWITLAGNNSGTQFLQENASGAPSWATAAGTGTVTSVTCFGVAITSTGTCTTTGQIPGIATNTAASAGNVGEYITSTLLGGAAVGLTSTVAANITSVSLTAGDWQCTGTAWVNSAGTINIVEAWTSSTSAAAPTRPNNGGDTSTGIIASTNQVGLAAGSQQFLLSGTTTVYLSTVASFSSTANAYGFIGCRRMR